MKWIYNSRTRLGQITHDDGTTELLTGDRAQKFQETQSPFCDVLHDRPQETDEDALEGPN